MPYIRYTYDPDNYSSKEEAYKKANINYLLGIILFFSTIGILIYYITSLVATLKGSYSKDIIYAFALIIAISVINFFVIFAGVNKKDVAEEYFLIYFCIIFDLSGLVTIIVSIKHLYQSEKYIALLIGSIFAIIIVTFLTVLIFRKINGYEFPSKKFFTSKEVAVVHDENIIKSQQQNDYATDEVNYEENIFCHKCGKKMPSDSQFCSVCGTKLK